VHRVLVAGTSAGSFVGSCGTPVTYEEEEDRRLRSCI
jgi:predicted acylesterase/phospholipase RssA